MGASEQRRPNRQFALGIAITATVGLGLWMANREPFFLGPIGGSLICLLACAAWVAWLVPFPEGIAVPWRSTPLGKVKDEPLSAVAWMGLALAVLGLGAVFGGYKHLPVTILAALLCLVPPARHRPGLAVLLLVAAIYTPLLGTSALWDPWETHYGEVAREILARNDWISLWWAQDKWFWSKPVLLFWMEALSMGALGVDFMPDANPAHPEWAVRLPTFLMSLLALAAIYAAMSRRFDARTGALAALVTATMPQFFFISHQAITDLPLVAAITIAACCLLLVIGEDPEREATVYQIGRWKLSFQHFVLFAVFALVLPQAVYLISRNLSWIEGHGLVAHPDRVLYGSAGNVGVPGNPNPHDQAPRIGGLAAQPFVQGLVWLGALFGLGQILRRERRLRPLLMFAFYFFCAIAFMAKGLPGIAIPGAAALCYLVASGRWQLLGQGALRVSTGALLIAVVSLPWYVAMYLRHGAAFTNRLLIHDHINRLASGVHGDKGTIEYFLAQIGYAAFPWIALVPAALMIGFAIHSSQDREGRGQIMLFVAMWFLSSFVLFSAMVTKFHHYILPSIVPAAILIAVALARCWGPRHPRATVVTAVATLCLVAGFTCLVGDARGVIPAGSMHTEDWVLQDARPVVASALLAVGLAFGVLARRDLGRVETKLKPAHLDTSLGVALILGACLLALVGRDLSWATSARPQGYERLIHLFVYKYGRLWPEHLDYRPILTGFAVAAVVAALVASFRSWRPIGVRALAALAVLFCAWGLNVYMVDLADHWSIRRLTARYYAERASADEPLVAWQMNWKGENFYTGNRVHVFAETDNKRIEPWLEKNKGRTAYFVLEHSRLPRLKKLVPQTEIEELTDKRDCNKLLLVRLEI